MGFIRFLGNVIAFLTVIIVLYSGYKIYKSKNYLSKRTLITILVAVIGISIGDPLMNMHSKAELTTAKEHSERIESKKEHSESIRESVALSRRIESSNSKIESKSNSEKRTSSNDDTIDKKSNSDAAFIDALNKLNTGFAVSATYDKNTDTVTWIGFDDWKNWNNDELQGVLEKIQVVTLRQAVKYDVYGPKIIVQLPDGSTVATREIGGEFNIQQL